jgi:hypothetical protein
LIGARRWRLGTWGWREDVAERGVNVPQYLLGNGIQIQPIGGKLIEGWRMPKSSRHRRRHVALQLIGERGNLGRFDRVCCGWVRVRHASTIATARRLANVARGSSGESALGMTNARLAYAIRVCGFRTIRLRRLLHERQPA